MSDQPLIQYTLPVRQGDKANVTIRLSDNQDLATIQALLGPVVERLAPLSAGLQAALEQQPAAAVGAMQQAGMNPQPVPQQAPPTEAFGSPGPPPTWAQPAPRMAEAACLACGQATGCPDCGSGTSLRLKQSRTAGKGPWNVHACNADSRHKVVWCKSPMPPAVWQALGSPQGLFVAQAGPQY